MFLMLDTHVGLFVSYNSAGLPRPVSGRSEVRRAFLDRYFPDQRPVPKDVDPAMAKKDASDVIGTYYVTRRAESTALKIAALLGQTGIHKTADNQITLDDAKNLRGESKKWREIGPLLYHEVEGPDTIAFRRDGSGKVKECLPQAPVYELQRVPWYENQNLIAVFGGGNLVLCLLTLLFWPIAVIVRKRYERRLFAEQKSRFFYFLSRLVCLVEIGFIAVIMIPLTRAEENIAFLGDGLDPWLKTMHVFGWMMIAGVIFLLIASIWFSKGRGLGRWGRLHAFLLAAGGLIFALIAWHSHLFDTSLKF